MAIPAIVQSNLGIQFARAEQRIVQGVLRLPGRFEFAPLAQRIYSAPVAGRLELMVGDLESVRAGTVLFRVHSPEWHKLQQELLASQSQIERARNKIAGLDPRRAAHRGHEASLEVNVRTREQYAAFLEQITGSGAGRGAELHEARVGVSQAQVELAEAAEKESLLDVEEAELYAELRAGEQQFAQLLQTASALAGYSAAELVVLQDGLALWQRLAALEVKADFDCEVVELYSLPGAWVAPGVQVLRGADPNGLRFRAVALQGDIFELRDGLPVRVVPVLTNSEVAVHREAAALTGTLKLASAGDADARTLDLVVALSSDQPWARAGVAALAEIQPSAGGNAQVAIPITALQRDGLDFVFFRRDHKNPSEVVRVLADLGPSDGRWIAVLSGLRVGDEVVVDGGYQLMLASSGTIQKGGHFHADGTFHEDEE